MLFSCAEITYIQPDQKIEGAKIQPAEALKIAEKYIDEHATYLWKDKNKLKTHIVKKRKYYYIMRTDYPAKSIRYYMQPAIRINSKTGEVKIIEKK